MPSTPPPEDDGLSTSQLLEARDVELTDVYVVDDELDQIIQALERLAQNGGNQHVLYMSVSECANFSPNDAVRLARVLNASCPNLQHLDLSGTSLGCLGIRAIADMLATSSIEEITLSRLDLGEYSTEDLTVAFDSLCDAYANSTRIKVVRLDQNPFLNGYELLKVVGVSGGLAHSIRRCRSLQSLFIADCDLTTSVIVRIARALQASNRSIIELDLSGFADLNQDAAIALRNVIEANTGLEELYLNDTHKVMENDNARTIWDGLGLNRELRVLQLPWQLIDEDFSHWDQILTSRARGLKVLKIDGITLPTAEADRHNAIRQLMNPLLNNRQLQSLHVSSHPDPLGWDVARILIGSARNLVCLRVHLGPQGLPPNFRIDQAILEAFNNNPNNFDLIITPHGFNPETTRQINNVRAQIRASFAAYEDAAEAAATASATASLAPLLPPSAATTTTTTTAVARASVVPLLPPGAAPAASAAPSQIVPAIMPRGLLSQFTSHMSPTTEFAEDFIDHYWSRYNRLPGTDQPANDQQKDHLKSFFTSVVKKFFQSFNYHGADISKNIRIFKIMDNISDANCFAITPTTSPDGPEGVRVRDEFIRHMREHFVDLFRFHIRSESDLKRFQLGR